MKLYTTTTTIHRRDSNSAISVVVDQIVTKLWRLVSGVKYINNDNNSKNNKNNNMLYTDKIYQEQQRQQEQYFSRYFRNFDQTLKVCFFYQKQ